MDAPGSFSDIFGSKETNTPCLDFLDSFISCTDAKNAEKESNCSSISEHRTSEPEEEVPVPNILKAHEETDLIKKWQHLYKELEKKNRKQNNDLAVYEERFAEDINEIFQLKTEKTALTEKYESVEKERTSLQERLDLREAELEQFKSLVQKQFNDDNELRDLQKKLSLEIKMHKKSEKDLQQSRELLVRNKETIKGLKIKNKKIMNALLEFSKILQRNRLLSPKNFKLMKDLEENCGTRRKNKSDELNEVSSLSEDENIGSNSMIDETLSPVKEESISNKKEKIDLNLANDETYNSSCNSEVAVCEPNFIGELESCEDINMKESESDFISSKTQDSSNEKLSNNQDLLDKISNPSPDSNFPNVCSEADSLCCEDVEISEACFDDIKKGITGLILKSEHFVPLSPIPRSPSPRIITRTLNKNVKIQKIELSAKKGLQKTSNAPVKENSINQENRPKSSPEHAARRNILSHQTSGGFEPHILEPTDDSSSVSNQSSLELSNNSEPFHYISLTYTDEDKLKIEHQGNSVYDFFLNADKKRSVCVLSIPKKGSFSSGKCNESSSNSHNVSILPSRKERIKSVLSVYYGTENRIDTVESVISKSSSLKSLNASVEESPSCIRVMIDGNSRLKNDTSQLDNSISSRNTDDSCVTVEKCVDILLDENSEDETVEGINNDNQPHVSSSCDVSPSKNVTSSKYPISKGVHHDSIKKRFTKTHEDIQKASAVTNTFLMPEKCHDSAVSCQADIAKEKSSDKIRKLSYSSIENLSSNDMIADPPSETKMGKADCSKLSTESDISVKMSNEKNTNTSVADSLNQQQKYKIHYSDEESKVSSGMFDSLEQENPQNIQNENISSPLKCDISSDVNRYETEIVSPHKPHANLNCKLSPIKPNTSTESQSCDFDLKKHAIKRQENIQSPESGCPANSMETGEMNKSNFKVKLFSDILEPSPKKQKIKVELPEMQLKTELVTDSKNSHNDLAENFSRYSPKLLSENLSRIEVDTNDNKIKPMEISDVPIDTGIVRNDNKESGQLYNIFKELEYSIEDTKISPSNDVAEIQNVKSKDKQEKTEKLENKESPVITSDTITFSGHSSQEIIQRHSSEVTVNNYYYNTVCKDAPVEMKVSCLDEQNMIEKNSEINESNKPSSMIGNSENNLANNVQVFNESLKPKKKPKHKKKNANKISIRQENQPSDVPQKKKKKKLKTCQNVSDSSAILSTELKGSAHCNESLPEVKTVSIKKDVPAVKELLLPGFKNSVSSLSENDDNEADEQNMIEKNSERNEFDKPSSMIENSENYLANNVQVSNEGLKPKRKKKNSNEISIKQRNQPSDVPQKKKKKKLKTCQNVSDSSAILPTRFKDSANCNESSPEVKTVSIKKDVPATEELLLPDFKNSVSSLSENDANKTDQPNMIEKNSEGNEFDKSSSMVENSENYLRNNVQVSNQSLKRKRKKKNPIKVSRNLRNRSFDVPQKKKGGKLNTCQNISDSSAILLTEGFKDSSLCSKSLPDIKTVSIKKDDPAVEELNTKEELLSTGFKNSVPSLSENDVKKTGDVPCFSGGEQIILPDSVEPMTTSGVDDLANVHNNVLESSENAEGDKFFPQPFSENLHIVHAEVHCSLDSTKDNEVLNTVFENEENPGNDLLNKPELLNEVLGSKPMNNVSSISVESDVKNDSDFKDEEMVVDTPLYPNCSEINVSQNKDHDSESVKNQNMLPKADKVVENILAASVNECTLNTTPVSDCGETVKPQVQPLKITERRNSIQSTISENESPLVIVEDTEEQHSEPVSIINEDVAETAVVTNQKSSKKNKKRKMSNPAGLNKKKKSKDTNEDVSENKLSISKVLEEIDRIKIEDLLAEDSHFKRHLHTLTNVLINPSNASGTASALYEIFHYLSLSRMNPLLSFSIQKDNSVFFPLSEKCIVAALPLIERKRKPHLAGLIPTAITSLYYLVLAKQSIPKTGLSAFCRIFTGLCKSLSDKKKPMMLCCDLIKNKHPFAPYLIASMVGVWPELFHSTDDTEDIEFLLQNCIAYGVYKKPQTLNSTDWKHCKAVFSKYFLFSSAVFDLTETAETLLGYLIQLVDSEPSENDYMVTESIVILSTFKGWNWAKQNFLNNFVKPSLIKYAKAAENQRAFSILCELYADIGLIVPEFQEACADLMNFFILEKAKDYVKDCAAQLWLKFLVLKKMEIPEELFKWVNENQENLLGTQIEFLLKRRLMADSTTFTEEDIISDS